MSRLAHTLRLDAKLQAKNKLYAIGIFVALLLGLALRFITSGQSIGPSLVAFYVLGLGGTTFMFAASMLLLDRSQGTLSALRVSMLSAPDYIFSKVLTLTAFAGLESAIVYFIAGRGIPTNFLWLAAGLLVLGSFYTWIGLGMVAPYRSVTTFLLPYGSLTAMILQLPVLSLLEVGPPWIWWIIPTQAPLLLMQAAFEPLSQAQWIYAVSMSLLMLGLARRWSISRVATHTGLARGAS